MLSRAINGFARLLPTMGASFVLVGLHYLFAMIAFRSERFGNFVKGSPRKLVEGGEIRWEAMRKSHIGKDDLLAAIRSEGNVADLEKIDQACLERSGNSSVIPAPGKAEVLEVSVPDGTQTVRIVIQR